MGADNSSSKFITTRQKLVGIIASSKPIMSRGRLIGLLVLLVIFALIPLAVSSPYHLTLLITVGYNAVLAMGFILLLRTGLITLAVAGFWGVGAYTSTMLAMNLGLPFWLSLPAAGAMAGLVALGSGYLFVRNPGFAFVIMTMILGMVFVVLIGGTEFFGGYIGLRGIPPPDPINIPLLPPIEFTSKIPYYYTMLGLFAVVVIIYSAFYTSSIGRAWTAIGLSSQLAASQGINVFGYRLLAFVLAGATAGLMGGFYAHFIGSLIPETFNVFKTVYVHVYAILGGIGSPFLGPLVGSLLMVFFPELMRITREIEPIITGTLLIVLVIFLPRGIMGLPGVRVLAADPGQVMAKMSKAFKSRSSSRGAGK